MVWERTCGLCLCPILRMFFLYAKLITKAMIPCWHGVVLLSWRNFLLCLTHSDQDLDPCFLPSCISPEELSPDHLRRYGNLRSLWFLICLGHYISMQSGSLLLETTRRQLSGFMQQYPHSRMDERHLQHRHWSYHSHTPSKRALRTADQLEEEADGHGYVLSWYIVSQSNSSTANYN